MGRYPKLACNKYPYEKYTLFPCFLESQCLSGLLPLYFTEMFFYLFCDILLNVDNDLEPFTYVSNPSNDTNCDNRSTNTPRGHARKSKKTLISIVEKIGGKRCNNMV